MGPYIRRVVPVKVYILSLSTFKGADRLQIILVCQVPNDVYDLMEGYMRVTFLEGLLMLEKQVIVI